MLMQTQEVLEDDNRWRKLRWQMKNALRAGVDNRDQQWRVERTNESTVLALYAVRQPTAKTIPSDLYTNTHSHTPHTYGSTDENNFLLCVPSAGGNFPCRFCFY